VCKPTRRAADVFIVAGPPQRKRKGKVPAPKCGFANALSPPVRGRRKKRERRVVGDPEGVTGVMEGQPSKGRKEHLPTGNEEILPEPCLERGKRFPFPSFFFRPSLCEHTPRRARKVGGEGERKKRKKKKKTARCPPCRRG